MVLDEREVARLRREHNVVLGEQETHRRGRPKVDPKEVLAVAAANPKLTRKELAEAFKVSQPYISKIMRASKENHGSN